MDILVINLMRLGDIIQSGPVVRRLRAEHPEARITLMVLDIFRGAAELLPGVDRLTTLPTLELAKALDREGWAGAYGRLYAWCAEHLTPRPDLVVNLTPTLMAGVLAYAAGASEVRGFAVDREKRVFTHPAWASYSLVVSKARDANPFNLVDLFLKGAGLSPDGRGLEVRMPAEAAGQVEAAIQALQVPKDTALVGLFPGASQPERQWPAVHFGALARALLASRPCHFFIFGSGGERALGEAVARGLKPGCVSLCLGETTLPQLAAYLARLDLLITNDTGPMHLAAAVGTRILALFLASARAHDTGPAGTGHVTLEPRLTCHPCLAPCAHPLCHDAVSPTAVAALAAAMLKEREALGPEEAGGWEDIRVYRAGKDPRGSQALLPLGRRPLEGPDFWRGVHRLAWARHLEGKDKAGEALVSWVRGHLAEEYMTPRDGLGIAEGRRVLGEICYLAAQGRAAAAGIGRLAEAATPSPARLEQGLKAIDELDGSLRRLAQEFPGAAAFIEFFFQEQRQGGGRDMGDLAQALAQAYEGLEELAAGALRAVVELAGGLPFRGEWLEGADWVAQDVQQLEIEKAGNPPHSEVRPCM